MNSDTGRYKRHGSQLLRRLIFIIRSPLIGVAVSQPAIPYCVQLSVTLLLGSTLGRNLRGDFRLCGPQDAQGDSTWFYHARSVGHKVRSDDVMLVSTEGVVLGEMLSTMRDRQLRLDAPLLAAGSGAGEEQTEVAVKHSGEESGINQTGSRHRKALPLFTAEPGTQFSSTRLRVHVHRLQAARGQADGSKTPGTARPGGVTCSNRGEWWAGKYSAQVQQEETNIITDLKTPQTSCTFLNNPQKFEKKDPGARCELWETRREVVCEELKSAVTIDFTNTTDQQNKIYVKPNKQAFDNPGLIALSGGLVLQRAHAEQGNVMGWIQAARPQMG
ncbi:hypothetical protein EGW08_020509 [Elysia chlorotica]|uniref:Uncharacterized protein n=1 Tax=Elysia chlorotica TaxID=188477 RepID=A0A3S1H3Y0_ELYCH|nr:hypothetical protein EGW08_020509 [Elysia chlorotica]